MTFCVAVVHHTPLRCFYALEVVMGDASRLDDTLEIQRDDSPALALVCFKDGVRTHDQDLGVLRLIPAMEKFGWIAYDPLDRSWWLTERGRLTKGNLTRL